MFVILGANGNTGRVAAESLIANGRQVRVVLRHERQADAWRARGAEVALADLDGADAVAALTAAFAGAAGVYVLLPPDATATDPLGLAAARSQRLAAAVAAAKVPHAVLLSSIGAQHATGNGPIALVHLAEQALLGVPGLARTFLRPSYFLENHASVLGAAEGHGILPTFLPADLPTAQIATSDIGRAAARALAEPPAAGTTRIWNLAGPADVSEREVAAVLGALLGKPIAVVESPLDQVVPTFTSFGISEPMAALYREMYEGIASGRVAWPAGEPVIRGRDGAKEVLARLLGRAA